MSPFKLKVGLTPVHCGHMYVQAGWMPGMDTLLSTVDRRMSTVDRRVSTVDRRVSKLRENI